MKIKKIKLLKALALTGAFGIVATVPVIVSACSSTSDNNTGGDSNNGGGSQTQNITPQIKTTSSLSGALSSIYDTTNTENTNTLIAQEIKDNIGEVFENGSALSAVSDLEVTVSHTFPESTWTGLSFDATSGNWVDSANSANNVTIAASNKLVYASKTEALNISSLKDLKDQLTDEKLQAILTDAGTTPAANTTYSVANALGFTNKALGSDNRDLLHVNVVGTTTSGSSTTTNYDLQIPVSDLNLVLTDLSVTVKGTNVTETTATTTLTYNIGINDAVTPQTGSTQLAEADRTDVNKALEALGYATSGTDSTYTYDSEKISQALGVYNCTFVPATDNPIVEDSENAGTYTIKLSATPNSGYVWEDGTSTAKEISFTATFTA